MATRIVIYTGAMKIHSAKFLTMVMVLAIALKWIM